MKVMARLGDSGKCCLCEPSALRGRSNDFFFRQIDCQLWRLFFSAAAPPAANERPSV